MTKFQADLFHFIRHYIMAHGYSPSMREVRAHFGCGMDRIYRGLTSLSRARRIVWHKGLWRGIELGDRAFTKGELDAEEIKNRHDRGSLLGDEAVDERGREGD
jgi:SOS-response transcriptional repressor LexA